MRKRLLDLAITLAVAAFFVAIFGGLLYLDYSAYRQRFPDAAPWTYLFRGGK